MDTREVEVTREQILHLALKTFARDYYGIGSVSSEETPSKEQIEALIKETGNRNSLVT